MPRKKRTSEVMPQEFVDLFTDLASRLETNAPTQKHLDTISHNLEQAAMASQLAMLGWARRGNPPTEPATPSPPAEPRLTVDLAKKTITLDGTTFDVSSDLALRWVKVLVSHPGEWISGPELKQHDEQLDGAEPHRFKHRLPPVVRALIDTHRSRGSRIRLA